MSLGEILQQRVNEMDSAMVAEGLRKLAEDVRSSDDDPRMKQLASMLLVRAAEDLDELARICQCTGLSHWPERRVCERQTRC